MYQIRVLPGKCTGVAYPLPSESIAYKRAEVTLSGLRGGRLCPLD